ncbi:MAG: hypothetical protein CL947_00565 [Epsilonproteobacteria bacterium]|nr:hypothetical protein [Campylobacterota bacterium]|tara:strand:- start:790 stop:1755 length:966 start_codon:yes stop_codon:yes gene_type:complete
MYKTILKVSLFFLCFFNTVISKQNQNLLLSQEPRLRFHNNEQIILKKNSYQELIKKWNKLFNNTWQKLRNYIEQDLQLPFEQVETLLANPNLAQLYFELKENDLQKSQDYIISEEDIDPEVLHFIKHFIQKFTTKKNIKILLSNRLSTITATSGTDTHTHFIICNSNLYSKENIKHFYEALSENNGIFYIEPCTNKSVRFIELSNLLLVGLLEAASHIEHQSNLFTFLLTNFNFVNKKLSQKAIHLCWHFTEIRSMIEAVLQSKNPLETALFIGKIRYKSKSNKERMLWKNLVNDIASCYTKESLQRFKYAIAEINSLYHF